MNVARLDAGLHTLTEDPALTARAQERALQLCEDGQWSHDGWDTYYGITGYRFRGENLAKGFGNAVDAHEALMDSPSHRANILNTRYQRFGVGYVEECDLTVQFFGGGFVF